MKILLFLILIFIVITCSILPVKHPMIISGNTYTKKILKDSTIVILNWNIHKESNLPKFQKELFLFMKKVDPNFLTFQEFLLKDNIQQNLKKETNVGWEFSPNIFIDDENAYSGVATASKVKPIYSKSYLSRGKEPFTNTPKVFLLTEYPIKNTNHTLIIINIHAINFKLSDKYFKLQIMNLMSTISKHIGPVIISGDFNTWKKSRIKFLKDQTREHNLLEVQFGNKDNEVKTTFGNKLDYMFYSKKYLKLVKNSQKIIQTFKSSDHKALYAEFLLK